VSKGGLVAERKRVQGFLLLPTNAVNALLRPENPVEVQVLSSAWPVDPVRVPNQCPNITEVQTAMGKKRSSKSTKCRQCGIRKGYGKTGLCNFCRGPSHKTFGV
jgi:ribosomal protein L37E